MFSLNTHYDDFKIILKNGEMVKYVGTGLLVAVNLYN